MTRTVAALLCLLAPSCAHLAGYTPDGAPECLTKRPEVQDACAKMAEYIGHPIELNVVSDGSAPPLAPDQPNAPWAYWSAGRIYCNIIIQEQHVASVVQGGQPLPHEALHCLLWVHTGDPDRGHVGPWW